MNEIQKIDQELDYLAAAAMRDAGSQKMLKFVKGDYFCDGKEVERGTQLIAHVVGWRQDWVKFWDRKRVERRMYRVTRGEIPPERNQLPDLDQTQWQIGIDGKNPSDPWSLQYLLPMENSETNEAMIFVTRSTGGRVAISELVNKYASRSRREPGVGQPLIRLQKTMMPTGSYGNVIRPLFEVVSFETPSGQEPMRDISPDAINQVDADMADEIPF